MSYNFICFEGNIGAGKTSLAKRISKDINGSLILEEFSSNPFLEKFYKEPNKYAFQSELFFMIQRYHQLSKIKQRDFFSGITVSDYFFIKSKLFAQNNLIDDELLLFNQLFDLMCSSLINPSLLVYLDVDIDCLQRNIRKRGRLFEQKITNKYLYAFM